MKMVCIGKNEQNNEFLTVGKIYEAIYSMGEFHRIRCDDGGYRWYNNLALITIDEWREKQLDDLEI
jgi:hypothetical protein